MASGWAGDAPYRIRSTALLTMRLLAPAASFHVAKATNFVMNAESRFRRPGDRPSQGSDTA